MLERITGETYVLRGNTNVGVYSDGERVYLIDTGTSKKNLSKIIETFRGREIVVLITHHHADHIQLNRWLQRKTGCEIRVPVGELSFVAFPELESYLLFGAKPPKELRREFFTAKPSAVKPLEDGMPLKPVPLPGHTPHHTGYVTPDGVLFCGDLYFSKDILDKYFYPYHASVSDLRKTLKTLDLTRFNAVVPSHGTPSRDPREDIDHMMKRIDEIEETVLNILSRPMKVEEIAGSLVERYELELVGGFWYLFRSFVSALIQDLEDRGYLIWEGSTWTRR